MKTTYLSFLVLVLAITAPLQAQRKVLFTLTPQIQHDFGYTEYIMDIRIPDGYNILVLKSELEFPLDVLTAGLEVGLRSSQEGHLAWSFAGSYLTNLNDPGGVMKDHDWATLDTVTYRVDKFSYTESDARQKSALFAVEGTLRVLHRDRFDLDLWTGYRYQKIEQDIIGWQGWYLDTNFEQQPQSGTERAVFYRVTYKTPHFGLRSRLDLSDDLTLDMRAAFAAVWASDFDDHLLRGKDAIADISGSGVISGINIDYRLPARGPARLHVELGSELTYFTASGSQTQRWYADDPGTPWDDAGDEFPGIPHKVNTLQANVGLKLGLVF
ncbi:MAG TPA: omptin family outer membrane protease [Candidatus Deferrimicrobium sp.]|nr:omptin family outer membrane protease [Candidatus Deferrimicrobium sp.]